MKIIRITLLLLMLLGIMTACTEKVETPVISLPLGGISALEGEIENSSLTLFTGLFTISSIQKANLESVFGDFDEYFCVTIYPEIPRSHNSIGTFGHYIVTRNGENWEAHTEDSTARSEWYRNDCTNWDHQPD